MLGATDQPVVAAPVGVKERLFSLDALRGVALCGILVINIRYFALPVRRIQDPSFPTDGLQAADFWSWLIGNAIFEDKMIGLFSLLFGAGIVLLGSVKRGSAPSRAVVFYTRMALLFVFGLAHAYLLWIGDILMTYAICGCVLYPLRRAPAGLLIGLGCALVVVGPLKRMGPGLYESMRPAVVATEASAQSSDARSETQESARSARRSFGELLSEPVQTEAMTGSWMDAYRWRAEVIPHWHFLGNFDFNFWRCGAFMLVGMGLMRLGALSATLPASVYWGWVIGGYVVGGALTFVGMQPQVASALGANADIAGAARGVINRMAYVARHVGALPMAIAHAGLVMLLVKTVVGRRALAPVASAGRMALSNYIMHSVICVIVFEGWGLGMFGKWGYAQLTLFVVCIWAAQLIVSPLWLKHFNFGPLEWVWRSATYRRWQGMRVGG